MDGGDEDEEHVHFKQVLRAYEHYREHAHARISEMECHAARLDRASRELLRLEDKFAALRRAVECNGRVLDAIVEPHAMFEDDEQAGRSMHARALLERPAAGRGATPSDADMEKVKSTLKQLARDWAEEGAAERAACYGPLLADIERLLPSESAARPNAKVLVPGAGLGRLAWECAARGFACQGNEVSYFMLLASNFVLNHAADLGQLEIYPYVHQSINVRAPADQLRPVPLPDTDPSRLPAHTPFSMCAGDFLAIYANQPGEWDCILTCFFIDTARDVSQYVRTIHAALRPGGVWCNVGARARVPRARGRPPADAVRGRPLPLPRRPVALPLGGDGPGRVLDRALVGGAARAHRRARLCDRARGVAAADDVRGQRALDAQDGVRVRAHRLPQGGRPAQIGKSQVVGFKL